MVLRLLQNSGFDWRNDGSATGGFYLKAIGLAQLGGIGQVAVVAEGHGAPARHNTESCASFVP